MQIERLQSMITYLMQENNGQLALDIPKLLPTDETKLYTIWRALVNLRLPNTVTEEYLEMEHAYLQTALQQKEVTSLEDLTPVEPQIYLWQGDITQLAVDAITNAANSEFLGCFIPNHHCIDNEIQTAAGVQVRLDCYQIRQKQGRKEPVGKAKLTAAYNLPANYIIHTVGPIANGKASPIKAHMLAECYRSVLALADKKGLNSVALCCISTGEFGYPQEPAAEIAVQTVRDYLTGTGSQLKVVFNVFLDSDWAIYQSILNKGAKR
ncbi:protein-ADP-ribose hydrolase [Aerococcaceae bacterium DSM 111020]|nr:protein-ADP-ribose hydrolase [Aerococcaceae bacterium DSM 111020]